MSRRNELTPSDIATIIQSAIRPVSEKVDDLLRDRVTRTDLKELRAEFMNGYVPRDVYEARHRQIEQDLLQLRKDYEESTQKVHERLESGKQQLEDRMKEQSKAQLSGRDQFWLRVTQVIGIVAVALTAFQFVASHWK